MTRWNLYRDTWDRIFWVMAVGSVLVGGAVLLAVGTWSVWVQVQAGRPEMAFVLAIGMIGVIAICASPFLASVAPERPGAGR